MPFEPELWALGQATHAAWASARLPQTCRFFNLHGSGIQTPYSVQYGAWWYPLQASTLVSRGPGDASLCGRPIGGLSGTHPVALNPGRPAQLRVTPGTRAALPWLSLTAPQDLDAVPRVNAGFTYLDGDGTVHTESANAHGLHATGSRAVAADHRGLVASQVSTGGGAAVPAACTSCHSCAEQRCSLSGTSAACLPACPASAAGGVCSGAAVAARPPARPQLKRLWRHQQMRVHRTAAAHGAELRAAAWGKRRPDDAAAAEGGRWGGTEQPRLLPARLALAAGVNCAACPVPRAL